MKGTSGQRYHDLMSQSTVALCIPERHLLRLVQVNLERQRYRVQPTQVGADLLALMAVEALIDLFVLDSDLRAPNVDELIAAIRADVRHAGARIVVLGKDRTGDAGGADLLRP